MAISRTKGHGWRAIPTQYRKASDTLTSTLAAFLFSSHRKMEINREAHLNYYTSADNRETSHHKTKINTNSHASLTKNTVKHKINTNKTKATFSRLLRHPGVETDVRLHLYSASSSKFSEATAKTREYSSQGPIFMFPTGNFRTK